LRPVRKEITEEDYRNLFLTSPVDEDWRWKGWMRAKTSAPRRLVLFVKAAGKAILSEVFQVRQIWEKGMVPFKSYPYW
jgi:hypothetical protein